MKKHIVIITICAVALLISVVIWQSKIRKTAGFFNELWNPNFDNIWSIEDKNDFLIALSGWLGSKCAYGEAMERLSDAEKTFYIIWGLEVEVNNGGFSQFFYNTSGNFANETADALRTVGADKTVEIYLRAIGVFGGEVPENRRERQAMLAKAGTDEVNEILSECSSEFCGYPDNLTELCYQFVFENREQFTRN